MALSLNEQALMLAEELIVKAEALGVAVHILPNGTRVIDCGIDVPGGLEAGRVFAEVCMGGLGRLSFTHLSLDSASAQHPVGDGWPLNMPAGRSTKMIILLWAAAQPGR
jgi:methenyltetrahydromethanopterin cyclohydrolase